MEINEKPCADPVEIKKEPTREQLEAMMTELRAIRSEFRCEIQKEGGDFHDALQIAEGVLEEYRIEQPKWWKRMDGTPILNDIAVRMAMAFLKAQKKS